jgi:intraflagellar transport protein 81
MTTEDDVRSKRDQVRDMEDQVSSLQESLEAALERNTKLVVFKQASTIALKKMRDKEDEVEKVTEEKRRIAKHTEDKENELRSQGKMGSKGGKMGKKDLEKYGATVMEKIVKYKKMKDELSLLRGELVILQRTEQILKSRDNNLDDFLQELERKKGIEVGAYSLLYDYNDLFLYNENKHLLV